MQAGSLMSEGGYLMDDELLSLAEQNEAMKPGTALTFHITDQTEQFCPSAAAVSVIL